MSPDRSFWEGRRVLITGHTGFQGSWLALWLSHLGAQVTGLALAPAYSPSLFELALRPQHARSVFGDIREPSTIARCMIEAKPEIVFHLAAQPLTFLSYQDPLTTYNTNVLGTVHLLEAIRQTDTVVAAVIATSDKCYENLERKEPYTEEAELGGLDPYSSSKACAELVLRAYRKSFFNGVDGQTCRFASARGGNVIGGGDWSSYRLVPDLVRAASSGVSAAIRDPDGVRPWQHVLELLSGYIRLAECLASTNGREYTEAWNFGPAEDDCRPVSYLVESFITAWGSGAQWHPAVTEIGPEAGILKIDSSKALTRLGWWRRLDLNQGLDWTFHWYSRQHRGASAEAITLEQIEHYESLKGTVSQT